MQLSFVPLLRIQRDLYEVPLGPARFQAYLRTMLDPRTHDLVLPLGALNPMGKPHVPARLDELLALGAETIGAAATAEAAQALTAEPGTYQAALVLADDAGGGWTNRATAEMEHRFRNAPLRKRGWIVGQLWTSEAPTPARVRAAVLVSAHRAAWQQRHGPALTLGQMLAQEGAALLGAGVVVPEVPAAELARVRAVLDPWRAETAPGVTLPALFGDAAAEALGHPPLGVPADGAWALALHEARQQK